jgi:hypothetical protein
MFMTRFADFRTRRQLTELADAGFKVAKDLHQQALAASTPRAKAELALAFAQVADEVRRTIALQARLERDAKDTAASGGTPRPARRTRRGETPDPVPPNTVKH